MRFRNQKRKYMELLGSEAPSMLRSEYSPAIEGLREWLALQLVAPRRATKETVQFHEGRIAGLREAVSWLKKLEVTSVLARADRN